MPTKIRITLIKDFNKILKKGESFKMEIVRAKKLIKSGHVVLS